MEYLLLGALGALVGIIGVCVYFMVQEIRYE